MKNKIPVITIDGPSGVGKSSLSRIIAQKLNWSILESGKMYRFIAFLLLNKKIPIVEKKIIPILKNLDFSFLKKKEIIYSKKINLQQVSDIASQIASFSTIRTILLHQQRYFRCYPGLVAEGRDMGTVVFPDAIIKFFLNASLESRTYRRMLQLKKNGYYINFKELLKQMKIRDKRDLNRSISPLYPSENAIILDSTNMSFEEVIKILTRYISKKNKYIF